MGEDGTSIDGRAGTSPALDQARLDDVLESISDGFYAVDRDWRYVAFNRAAEEYFGVRREVVLSKVMWDLFPQGRGTRFEAACQAAMNDGAVTRFETASALRPDRTVELRIGPLAGGGVTVTLTDITERVRAQEHLRLMVLELNHRVKNNLATVQAIAVQTLRGTESPAEAREAFLQRITALAAAHDILTREQPRGVGLADIARGVLDALHGDGERVRMQGPPARLAPRAALSLSMAFHELGTNALKYGALSAPGGEVALDWRREGRDLVVEWVERGGPAVRTPATRGFGSRLLERGLASELNGEVRLSFEPEGLRCMIRAPVLEEATEA